MSDLQTLVAQEVAKQLAAIAADQTTKKVLEFLKNRNSADAYVVEAGGDSTSWYRVWSDGFIEQGGWLENTDTQQTVSFSKPFSSSDYFVTVMIETNGNRAQVCMFGIGAKSAADFTFRTVAGNSANPTATRKTWYAAGF